MLQRLLMVGVVCVWAGMALLFSLTLLVSSLTGSDIYLDYPDGV